MTAQVRRLQVFQDARRAMANQKAGPRQCRNGWELTSYEVKPVVVYCELGLPGSDTYFLLQIPLKTYMFSAVDFLSLLFLVVTVDVQRLATFGSLQRGCPW